MTDNLIESAGPWGNRDMAAAPRDGTMLRLLIAYDPNELESHALADSEEPSWTIGFNSYGDTGEDRWQFVGWDWSQDRFRDGHGKVIAWLPFHLRTPLAEIGA